MTTQAEIKTYLFLKKSRQDSAGQAPLYVRISSVTQKPFEVNTMNLVPVVQWDQSSQYLIGKARNSHVSKEIRSILEKIEEVHIDLSSTGGVYDPEQFKLMLFGESQKIKHYTYQFIYAKHQQIEADNLAPGTWKNYYSTNKFFLQFIAAELNAKDIILARFNRQLMIEFITWLKRRKPEEGQRWCTAQKHVERLIRLLNFAVDMQYIPFNPVMNLKKKKIQKDRTYLDQSELELLQNSQFKSQSLDEVRDCFLFSCYTGLSFSDIKSFRKQDLVKDMSGNSCISKVRKKTQRTREIKFFVPLLLPAQDLIKKYANHPFCVYNKVLLPVRCNQAYNRQIKQIAKILAIDKELTSHAARHTFATTVAQDNGISLESISKMLGHTQIKTTQVYSRTTLKKVSAEMETLSVKFLKDKSKEIVGF